jgi:uncharacterized protein
MIRRKLEIILINDLGKGKVQIIYGPRRVGKTTLAKSLFPQDETLYLNADLVSTRRLLTPNSLSELERLVGSYKNIIIDEAQRVSDVGLVLKIMIDAHPEWNIIATGSSSFDLNSKVKEPLTGRAYEYLLLPLTTDEIIASYTYGVADLDGLYERLMRLGGYPGVFTLSDQDAERELAAIADKYIYKDTLELVELRQTGLLESLLTALAIQLGSEVSYQKLASLLGVSSATIQRYIKLLENAFIIYRVHALNGGAMNKLSNRKRKIYFYDLGIRNALLGDVSSVQKRLDRGALWEDLCMNEIRAAYPPLFSRFHYWRGEHGEIDLVAENRTHLAAFEFKSSPTITKIRLPKQFIIQYPDVKTTLVTPSTLSSTLADISQRTL